MNLNKLIILFILLFSGSIFSDAKDEILEAVRDGNVPKLKQLVRSKVKLDFSDTRELTPLMIAANDNNLEIVKILVESGANVNLKNKENGKTALMYAAGNGYTEVCQYLINSKGILLNAKDKAGKTALMYAVFFARKEIVQLLIESGANVNSRTDTDESAMSIAMKTGRMEIVNLLKEKGAKE
jgi:ankyrin repeat protein